MGFFRGIAMGISGGNAHPPAMPSTMLTIERIGSALRWSGIHATSTAINPATNRA